MDWELNYHTYHAEGEPFLAWLQDNSQRWRQYNFPREDRTPALQALGVCEEAGELAHAVLKLKQGIRGEEQQHVEDAADAIGDIVIYLAGLATSLNIDLQRAVEDSWDAVGRRDWKKNKVNGVSE